MRRSGYMFIGAAAFKYKRRASVGSEVSPESNFQAELRVLPLLRMGYYTAIPNAHMNAVHISRCEYSGWLSEWEDIEPIKSLSAESTRGNQTKPSNPAIVMFPRC